MERIGVGNNTNNNMNNNNNSYDYSWSLDVLTNGLEYTNTTIFLSLWKKKKKKMNKSSNNSNNNNDDCNNDNKLLGRYAIIGCCNCDGITRIASDQKYKLGYVRAIFDSNNYSNNNIQQFRSIPGLLYALQESCIISELSIITSSDSDQIEKLINLIHGKQQYPKINICQFQNYDTTDNDKQNKQQQSTLKKQSYTNKCCCDWWNVYSDEHIVVHATWVTLHYNKNVVIYLYSFKCLFIINNESSNNNSSKKKKKKKFDEDNNNNNSILIIPSHIIQTEHDIMSIVGQFQTQEFSNLPFITYINHKEINITLMKVFIFIPKNLYTIHVAQQIIPKKQKNWFVCIIPNTSNNTKIIDNNLLLRGQIQTKQWREHCYNDIIPYFPFNIIDKVVLMQTEEEEDSFVKNNNNNNNIVILVHTGMSIDFNFGITNNNNTSSFHIIDRNQQRILQEKVKQQRIQQQQQQENLWNRNNDNNNSQDNYTIPTTTTNNNSNDCSDNNETLNNDDDNNNGNVQNNVSRQSYYEEQNARWYWPNKLKDFLILNDNNTQQQENNLKEHIVDDNEIDIESVTTETEDEDEVLAVAVKDAPVVVTTTTMIEKILHDSCRLLILGTGCASPSPYRNASGYVIIIPKIIITNDNKDIIEDNTNVITIVLEVGEGFCTQWNRYFCNSSSSTSTNNNNYNNNFSSIQLIWLSHAHWDHYGGLCQLLIEIRNEKIRNNNNKKQRSNCSNGDASSSNKSRRLNNDDEFVPWVIAPPKILTFLQLVFGNQGHLYYNAVCSNEMNQMKQVCDNLNNNTLRDQTGIEISFWRNIRVEHSCDNAYGCIFGLQKKSNNKKKTNNDDNNNNKDNIDDKYNNKNFIFCFSGDTRPSFNIVQNCKNILHEYDNTTFKKQQIDFMLHEATYVDTEKMMSVAKKHSTITEAIMVGRDACVDRLLLTHFSQRYDDVPDIETVSSTLKGNTKIGFALDGMLVPLFDPM